MSILYNHDRILINGEHRYICIDWDQIGKKLYYPSGLYQYNVELPACIPEAQAGRYIRRVHGL